jgi:hypothetical protein
MGRHVARMGRKGIHIGILWESEGKKTLERTRRRREDNNKTDLREIG